MHSLALLWLGTIPFAIGVVLFAYGGLRPMLYESTAPRSSLTQARNLWAVLFAGACLSSIFMGLIAFWLDRTSERPQIEGQVTNSHYEYTPRYGRQTAFSMLATNGARYRVLCSHYVRGLRDGDHVRVTFFAYDGETFALKVLSGNQAGYHEQLVEYEGWPMLVCGFIGAVLCGWFSYALISETRFRDARAVGRSSWGILTHRPLYTDNMKVVCTPVRTSRDHAHAKQRMSSGES